MITWNDARQLGLASILCVSFAAPLYAQSTDTTETAEPETSEIDETFDLGQDADADTETKVGEPYLKAQFEAFELRCIRTEDGNDPCQLYQLVKDENGQPVVEFSLFRLPEGGRAEAGATIVVPLETSLQEQLTLSIDGSNSRKYPFAFCNTVGCYSRIGLTSEDVAAFRRGREAKLTIVPIISPESKVELTMSLSGFTKGIQETSFPQN
ncbi:MAG: invasion associated locus B family protein [Paracoccaceae bacterium]